jgi:hypothetical protein
MKHRTLRQSLRQCVPTIILLLAGLCPPVFSDEPKAKPSEVLCATYDLANNHRYEEAEKNLTKQAIAQLHGIMAQLAGGSRKIWDGWTKNGTISRIEILNQKVDGAKATVRYRLHYKDGTSKEDEDDFALVAGQWKFLP